MHFLDDSGGGVSTFAPVYWPCGEVTEVFKEQLRKRRLAPSIGRCLAPASRTRESHGQSSLQCPAPWHIPAVTLSPLSLRFQSWWAPLSGAAHARSLFSTDHLLLRDLRDQDFPVTAATASSQRHLDAPSPAVHLPCLCPSSTAGLQERVLRPLDGVPQCPFTDTGLSQAADALVVKVTGAPEPFARGLTLTASFSASLLP